MIDCDTMPEEESRELEVRPIQMRMLNLDISDSDFVELEGGLLVKDFLILDKGSWTDSLQKTELVYTPEVLERDAGNWKENGVWTRHTGGQPRNITDRVGRVKNPRGLDGAVWGDLFFHCRTQNSRDAAEMIRSGEASAVSVEHGGEEMFDKKLGKWVTKSLEYYGLAIVDRGACATCGKKKHGRKNEAPVCETVRENEATVMDEKEKQMVADMELRMKGLEGKFDALPKEAPDMKELSAKYDALVADMNAMKESYAKEMSEAKEKIKALENTPNPKGTVKEMSETSAEKLKVDAPLRVHRGEMTMN
jgi:hypothetical protein